MKEITKRGLRPGLRGRWDPDTKTISLRDFTDHKTLGHEISHSDLGHEDTLEQPKYLIQELEADLLSSLRRQASRREIRHILRQSLSWALKLGYSPGEWLEWVEVALLEIEPYTAKRTVAEADKLVSDLGE